MKIEIKNILVVPTGAGEKDFVFIVDQRCNDRDFEVRNKYTDDPSMLFQ